MNRQIYFLLLLSILTGCAQKNSENQYQDIEILEQYDIQNPDDTKVLPVKNMEEGYAEERVYGSLEFTFTDFDFTIYNASFYENRIINGINKDTVSTYLELGEYLDSATIEIHHGGVHNIEIYQMHENSISIQNEGPHCDLIDWKHYYSDWVRIKQLNNYDFVAETYTEKDWEIFIDISNEELQNAVLNHCGEEWAEHISEIKNYNDYPSSVSMSRIFFKIVLTHNQTEKITEQIIAIEIPMGC